VSFFRKKSPTEAALGERLPPGQYHTDKWPVLHYGQVPRFDRATWDFRIQGLVEQPVRLSYDEFMALPKITITRDIHCVTRWSRFDTSFTGVPFREVMKLVQLKPNATHALILAEQGFTTNLPLSDLDRDDVLFAAQADGEDLLPEHGWPLRLVVPHLYFWKSAKWVRGLELLDHDEPGFWEQYGYHMRGDPWREERYDWQ
jgi:DMSO/TMAO reductase YedYZ molybdopterin-dependent catalytic subunit